MTVFFVIGMFFILVLLAISRGWGSTWGLITFVFFIWYILYSANRFFSFCLLSYVFFLRLRWVFSNFFGMDRVLFDWLKGDFTCSASYGVFFIKRFSCCFYFYDWLCRFWVSFQWYWGGFLLYCGVFIIFFFGIVLPCLSVTFFKSWLRLTTIDSPRGHRGLILLILGLMILGFWLY